MRLVLFAIVLFFAGCSFKAENQYIWRKDSSNSFESYRNYFLAGKDQLALSSLKRAIMSAKNSADIRPLSKIYLGVCALHVAVLIDDKCEGYLSLSDLLSRDDATWSYYYMLRERFGSVEIDKLPSQYREFISDMKESNFHKAIEDAKKIENISSMLVAFSLLKEHLSAEDVEFLTKKLSIYGYKKPLISWLKYSKSLNSVEKNRKIDKVLHVIE